MVTKKKTTKKQAKPKTKVVYRTKYVEKEDNDNPFKEATKMMGTGMGLVIGMGVTSAVVKELKNL